MSDDGAELLSAAAALRWSRPDLAAALADHVLEDAAAESLDGSWLRAAGWAVHARSAIGDGRECASEILDGLVARGTHLLDHPAADLLRVELAVLAAGSGRSVAARTLLTPVTVADTTPEMRADALCALARCAMQDRPSSVLGLIGRVEATWAEVGGRRGDVGSAVASLVAASAERRAGRPAAAVDRAVAGLARLDRARGARSESPSPHVSAGLSAEWISGLLEAGRIEDAREGCVPLEPLLRESTRPSRQLALLRLTVARTVATTDVAAATRALHRAARDAAGSGAPDLESVCWSTLAALQEKSGDGESALESLRLGLDAQQRDTRRGARFRAALDAVVPPSYDDAADQHHSESPARVSRNGENGSNGHRTRNGGRRAGPDSVITGLLGPADEGALTGSGRAWTDRGVADDRDHRGSPDPAPVNGAAEHLADTSPPASNGTGGGRRRRSARAPIADPSTGTDGPLAGPSRGAGAPPAGPSRDAATSRAGHTSRDNDNPLTGPSRDAEDLLTGPSRATEDLLTGPGRATENLLTGPGRATEDLLTGPSRDIEDPLTGPHRGTGEPHGPAGREDPWQGWTDDSPIGRFLAESRRRADELEGRGRVDLPPAVEIEPGPPAPVAPPVEPDPTPGRAANPWSTGSWSAAGWGRPERSAGWVPSDTAPQATGSGGRRRRADPDDTAPLTAPPDPHLDDPAPPAEEESGSWLKEAMAELDLALSGAPQASLDAEGCVVVIDLARDGRRFAGRRAGAVVRAVADQLPGRLPPGARVRHDDADAVSVVLPGWNRSAATEWMHGTLPGVFGDVVTAEDLPGTRLRAAVHDIDGPVGAQLLQQLETGVGRHGTTGRVPFRVEDSGGGRRRRKEDATEPVTAEPATAPSADGFGPGDDPASTDGLGLADLLAGALAAYRNI